MKATKDWGLWIIVAIIAVTFAVDSGAAEIKLNPGPIKGKEVHLTNARDYAYCEFAPIMGKKPNLIAQFYNTSGTDPSCPDDAFKAIDEKALAKALGVEYVYLNPEPRTARRHWVMDELWVFVVGETVDFMGVKASWMAAMSPEAMKGVAGKNYHPGEIHRKSKYLYHKGSRVFLMRVPGGKTFVMQSYATEVDKNLTFDQLPQLASKLKNLPKGWKFDTKVLTKDLTIDPQKAKGVAHIVRDELHDVYEGCGFDAACNYVP